MGGGGDRGVRNLSKVGIALTIIFVISLLVILAQLFYVLWRRRVTYAGRGVRDGANHLSIYSSSESSFSSKEFLFFFCMRSHSNSITVTGSNDNRNLNRQLDMEVVDIDLLKLHGMFGPSRFLFTIKEEEREGFESPADKSMHGKEAKKIDDFNRVNRVSLEECFKAADSVLEVETDGGGGGGGGDATPFSTPCASPQFFIPVSPVNNVVNDPIPDVVICSDCKTAPLMRTEK